MSMKLSKSIPSSSFFGSFSTCEKAISKLLLNEELKDYVLGHLVEFKKYLRKNPTVDVSEFYIQDWRKRFQDELESNELGIPTPALDVFGSVFASNSYEVQIDGKKYFYLELLHWSKGQRILVLKVLDAEKGNCLCFKIIPNKLPEEWDALLILQGKHHTICLIDHHKMEDFYLLIFPFMEDVPLTGYNDLWNYIKHIAEAINHCHAHSIVHGDIKPSNILWDGNEATLIDFGHAVYMDGSVDFDAKGYGTDDYFPPEVIYEDRHTFARDIWALGVTILVLVYNKIPWERDDEDLIPFLESASSSDRPWPSLCAHHTPSFPCTDDCIKVQRILFTLLKEDPNARPTSDHLEAVIKDILK